MWKELGGSKENCKTEQKQNIYRNDCYRYTGVYDR